MEIRSQQSVPWCTFVCLQFLFEPSLFNFYNFYNIFRSAFLIGIPMTILTIQLPQRLQAVDGNSPLEAGIHLLALAVLIGSFIGNGLGAVSNRPAIIFILVGSAVELIGASLLTTIPVSTNIPHAMYAYEAVTGLGVGSIFSMLMLVAPQSVEVQDLGMLFYSTKQFSCQYNYFDSE
jgi:hypothetical protein